MKKLAVGYDSSCDALLSRTLEFYDSKGNLLTDVPDVTNGGASIIGDLLQINFAQNQPDAIFWVRFKVTPLTVPTMILAESAITKIHIQNDCKNLIQVDEFVYVTFDAYFITPRTTKFSMNGKKFW